jgi:Protein of unknown function (DUF3558)
MRSLLLLVTLCTACGEGEPQRASAASPASQPELSKAPKVDACSLLTSEEIEAAVGWKLMKAEPSSYGATAVCNFSGPQEFAQSVSLVVAPGMPEVGSSAEMVEWRRKQVEGGYGDVKFIITPIEGLGFPAIQNAIEGTGLAAIEVAAKGFLLDVTTSTLEQSKALASKALARLP